MTSFDESINSLIGPLLPRYALSPAQKYCKVSCQDLARFLRNFFKIFASILSRFLRIISYGGLCALFGVEFGFYHYLFSVISFVAN
jgi:hypothetical protein